VRRVLDKPGKDLGNVTGSLWPGVCLFGTATISAGGGAAVRFEYRGTRSHDKIYILFLTIKYCAICSCRCCRRWSSRRRQAAHRVVATVKNWYNYRNANAGIIGRWHPLPDFCMLSLNNTFNHIFHLLQTFEALHCSLETAHGLEAATTC
jgi:hypothetical protein